MTTPDQGVEHIPEAWSPVEDRLAVSVGSGDEVQLWMWTLPDLTAGRFGTVTSSSPFNTVFSPDGSWIAYTERHQGVATYLQPVAGGNRIAIGRDDELVHHPLFLPDSRLVYFPGGNPSAVVVDLRTTPAVGFGRPAPLPGRGLPVNVTRRSQLNHDVGPDGRFVTILSDDAADGAAPADRFAIVRNWFEDVKRLAPVR